VKCSIRIYLFVCFLCFCFVVVCSARYTDYTPLSLYRIRKSKSSATLRIQGISLSIPIFCHSFLCYFLFLCSCLLLCATLKMIDKLQTFQMNTGRSFRETSESFSQIVKLYFSSLFRVPFLEFFFFFRGVQFFSFPLVAFSSLHCK
jgi:hypothetical protein